MTERQIARAVAGAMEKTARRTRANERARVTGIDSDTGNVTCDYNGATIVLPRQGVSPTIDSFVSPSRTPGGWQISQGSCYGGGG
jgi:hypothetical protein